MAPGVYMLTLETYVSFSVGIITSNANLLFYLYIYFFTFFSFLICKSILSLFQFASEYEGLSWRTNGNLACW